MHPEDNEMVLITVTAAIGAAILAMDGLASAFRLW